MWSASDHFLHNSCYIDSIHEYHVVLGDLKESEEMSWGEMYLAHLLVLVLLASSCSNLTP